MKRKIVIVFCLLVAAFSLYKYFEPDREINEAKHKYDDIINEVIEEKDDHLDINFEQLLAQNKDTVGWIYIPNTEQFSYPIVRSYDNHEYLITGFNGEDSEVGVPFVDTNCNYDFTDFNTIIWGHYTVSHYMFGELYDFMNEKLYQNFKTVEIYTPDGKLRIYDIYAAREVYVDSTMTFTCGEFSPEGKQAFINEGLSQSRFNWGVNVDPNSPVINLLCCTQGVDHEKRMVVSATLKEIIDLNQKQD